MKYRLLRTDKFSDQLNDILFYIAEDSGSVDTALSVLNRIEADVLKLSEFPESGSPPHYAILRRQGYRVLVTMRWLIFYKVDAVEKTVTLYAIADECQEYLRLL